MPLATRRNTMAGFDHLDIVGRTVFGDGPGGYEARVDELRAL